MPFVQVPKDLSKVKTKIALNLTKRQIICFSCAAMVGVPTYFLTKNIIGTDIAAILMLTIVLPFFAFAIYEKDGVYLEKVLKNIIVTKFVKPTVRPYKTENLYAQIEKNNKILREARLVGNTKNKTRKRAGKKAKYRKAAVKRQ